MLIVDALGWAIVAFAGLLIAVWLLLMVIGLFLLLWNGDDDDRSKRT